MREGQQASEGACFPHSEEGLKRFEINQKYYRLIHVNVHKIWLFIGAGYYGYLQTISGSK
jgi:hypothetical protein